MLKINRNSWHYRLYDKKYYPLHAKNLCMYVHRVLWSLVCLFFEYAFYVVLTLLLPIIYPVAFLFGHKPNGNLWVGGYDGILEQYKPIRFFNRYIYPIDIVWPLLMLWAISFFYCIVPNPASQIVLIVFVFVLGFGALGSMLYAISRELVKDYRLSYGLPNLEHESNVKTLLTNNEKLSIVWEYIKARKNKVCPLITFED